MKEEDCAQVEVKRLRWSSYLVWRTPFYRSIEDLYICCPLNPQTTRLLLVTIAIKPLSNAFSLFKCEPWENTIWKYVVIHIHSHSRPVWCLWLGRCPVILRNGRESAPCYQLDWPQRAVCVGAEARWGGGRYRGTVITPVVLPCRTPLGYFGGTGQTHSSV
jgi:hypothetical protein